MPQHYQHELLELKEKLLTMASHAETAVTRAMKALVDNDEELAKRVKEADAVIDRFEMEIDDAAISLLLKAPLATDLRLTAVAMKISHDLERVGDEATTIARRSIELSREPQLKPYVDLPKSAALALQMLKDALDAFVNRLPQKAREVIPRDKQVDELNKLVQRELVEFMLESRENIGRCLNLMVISKSLERIADHATNIAEEVVYLYEGRDIRHSKKNLSAQSGKAKPDGSGV